MAMHHLSDSRMAEYAGISEEELASAFIASTCQLIPKLFSTVSDQMCAPCSENPCYYVMCGSSVEFYIRPLNTCIDDTDNLACKTDELAFSDDYPTLPSDTSDLADWILCYRIEPCRGYPGFVRLRELGEMNYDWKCKKFMFNQAVRKDLYAMVDLADFATQNVTSMYSKRQIPHIIAGPAIKCKPMKSIGLNSDAVRSFWCPQWPKEAYNWPIRPRKYGRPTMSTIAEVVQNGCHVVYAQHRSCRDDVKQWRLSFSFSELILLQSWTQTQQIVYHLLRFFAKRELIQKDCQKEDEVLCSYHLKTLMLWTCEEMPPEWWDSSSVIAICYELLQKLSEWLKKRNCPNYFILEANLFHETMSTTMFDKTEKQLNQFLNSGILGNWFIKNYIHPFIIDLVKFEVKIALEETTHFMNYYRPTAIFEVTGALEGTTHFMDYTPTMIVEIKGVLEGETHFMDYMSHLFEFWTASELETLDILLYYTYENTRKKYRQNMTDELSSGFHLGFKDETVSRCLASNADEHRLRILPALQNLSYFKYYDIVLYNLHVAYGLECGEISWESSLFAEFVIGISMQPKIIRSLYHKFPRPHSAQSSHFHFLCAQSLMENLTGTNCRPEVQLLYFLSMEYLNKAFHHADSSCNGIAVATMAYRAALLLAITDYQQAMHYCLAVLAAQHSRNESETLNARCLLFIDDVARIVGLCTLHRKIAGNDLQYIGGRLYLDLRLSPAVLSYYLAVLSAERMLTHMDLRHRLPQVTFAMDEYLTALCKPKGPVSPKSGTRFIATKQLLYCRTNSSTETESRYANDMKERVIDILFDHALEKMTSFYDEIQKIFGIQCSTVDCYRALYRYKCRQYDEVSHLCERILHEPDLRSDLKEFSIANVLLIPPLDSFFDRDLQSLLGFYTLIFFLSPMREGLVKGLYIGDSNLAHWRSCNVEFSAAELWCLRNFHYSSMRCRNVLGRNFLARYLRVRCLVDCNLPYAEAMNEFIAQRIDHPYEHIIRKFLLQKLHANEE